MAKRETRTGVAALQPQTLAPRPPSVSPCSPPVACLPFPLEPSVSSSSGGRVVGRHCCRRHTSINIPCQYVVSGWPLSSLSSGVVMNRGESHWVSCADMRPGAAVEGGLPEVLRTVPVDVVLDSVHWAAAVAPAPGRISR